MVSKNSVFVVRGRSKSCVFSFWLVVTMTGWSEPSAQLRDTRFHYLTGSLYDSFLERFGISQTVASESDAWEPTIFSLLPWDYSASEWDDNSSKYLYYYQTNGVSVVRIRQIWNGGSSSKPLVTDYFLTDEVVTVVLQEGERAFATVLSKGKQAPLKILRNNKFVLPNSKLPDTVSTWDEEDIDDLRVLFELLSKEREEWLGLDNGADNDS